MNQKENQERIYYDVFNGDADGIFALHQLRLAAPAPVKTTLITGVKRDIALLRKIRDVKKGNITVLDISLDKNRDELVHLLEGNNRVLYVDHHYSGDIPEADALEHHIEPSAKTCTSLIVNKLLQGRYSTWAICGAFGDNLDEQANLLAASSAMSESAITALKEMGELFNYNGYGSKIEDLHFHPARLYEAIQPYTDPLEFYASTDIVSHLRDGYAEDMKRAADQQNISSKDPHRLYILPAAPWARRVAGVFSNHKAREKPQAAHAVIVTNDDGTLQVSVRAPLNARKNADTLCRSFPSGGGRAAAAGINHLPKEMLDEFTKAFHDIFSNTTTTE
jgi:single-stranded DNA-specific DHH superfamily exonuclease